MDDVAALKAQVEKLSQELEIVKTNRDSILREKRILEGRITVDRSEVRNNPQLYRRLKRQADETGAEIVITDAEAERYKGASIPERFETNEAVYCSRDYVGREIARYKELKAEAEQAGKQLVIVNDVRQLPREALGNG